jgi:hypothetical protein
LVDAMLRFFKAGGAEQMKRIGEQCWADPRPS